MGCAPAAGCRRGCMGGDCFHLCHAFACVGTCTPHSLWLPPALGTVHSRVPSGGAGEEAYHLGVRSSGALHVSHAPITAPITSCPQCPLPPRFAFIPGMHSDGTVAAALLCTLEPPPCISSTPCTHPDCEPEHPPTPGVRSWETRNGGALFARGKCKCK